MVNVVSGFDDIKSEEIGPAIILIDPQLGNNIGSAARAMLNCGLKDLRLVRPRDGWPNASAVKMASGATEVLNNTKVFSARLYASKEKSSSKVEVFLLRELDTDLWEAMVKPARKVRIGNKLFFNNKLFLSLPKISNKTDVSVS